MPNVEKSKYQSNRVAEKENKWALNSKCGFKDKKCRHWEEIRKIEITFKEKISEFEWDPSEARRKR